MSHPTPGSRAGAHWFWVAALCAACSGSIESSSVEGASGSAQAGGSGTAGTAAGGASGAAGAGASGSGGASGASGAAGASGGLGVGVSCTGTTPSFANAIVPLLLRSCSGGEICHFAFGASEGAATAYANLVDVPSAREPCTSMPLVAPGNLDGSELVHKLTGVGMCPDTQRMPLGTALTSAEIQSFADWICEGAPNN